MENKKCPNYWRCANRVGLFFVVLLAFCFIWYYLRPVEQELHLGLLKLSYFGFSGMNFSSFVLAAIQSYIWGYLGVGIWWLLGRCFNCQVEQKD